MKVIIVGNGFDLAHGIKSSYSDFLLFLIRKYITMAHSENHFHEHSDGLYYKEKEDVLFSVFIRQVDQEREMVNWFLSLSSPVELLSSTKKGNVIVEIKSTLITEYIHLNWSDFEVAFFNCLKKTRGKNSALLDRLHKECRLIRDYMIEYFSGIQLMPEILSLENPQIEKIVSLISPLSSKGTFVVNFNYTNTVSLYREFMKPDELVKIINVHGSADKHLEKDEIIFGYDDDRDPDFNDVLTKEHESYSEFFKSNSYFNSNVYNDLQNELNRDRFEVLSMGHSFGQSDAFILREIFLHPNCMRIQIFHYPKVGNLDFNRKVRQLRKLLNGTDKWKLIVPRNMSEPLPQPFSEE